MRIISPMSLETEVLRGRVTERMGGGAMSRTPHG